MRILLAFALLTVVGVTPALADSLGCGGDDTTLGPPLDMSIHDLAQPHDLSQPRDLIQRDARRDRRRRRRAAAAGMIALSGLGACGVALARRRVRA
ncbi:MAG TPA: hypothetical protein VF334_24285 [Polyangia bacterium]